jgi:hypothetical protein
MDPKISTTAVGGIPIPTSLGEIPTLNSLGDPQNKVKADVL